MAAQGKDRPTLTPTQARQAVKTGRMRYVLGISLTLVVIALAAAFIWS